MQQDVNANILARKLCARHRLAPDDCFMLDRIWTAGSHAIAAHENMVSEGTRVSNVPLIKEGWACRYRALEDGRRQILGFLLPGDLCDFPVLPRAKADFSVLSLSRVRSVPVRFQDVQALTSTPSLREALWGERLVQSSVEREWIVSIGQRSATERLAHLVCELFLRLRAVGFADLTGFVFPVTQLELADALGVSAVHANRTIRDLRERGLAMLNGRRAEILDFRGLSKLAMFDPGYLHLETPVSVPALLG